jgi:hypothetical protein
VETLHGRRAGILLIYFLVGCGSARTPVPVTLPSPPAVNRSPGSSWAFNYTAGVFRYQVSRSAAIESQSDSGSSREISTNTTHELITLMPEGDSGISFTAAIDTFSSTTQGLIGPVQPIQLPAQIAGIFSDSGLTISSDRSGNKCNPVNSVVVSDIHNLLTRFPARLSQGLVWQDSVSTAGCQAGIPTILHTTRSYVVSGEAVYEGQPILLIQRTDAIQASGEGAQQQHSLRLNASGTGNVIYYLDTKGGRVVRLTAVQELNLTITTSSRAQRFKESLRQDFRLLP